MRIASWIPKATNTHSEYVISLFHFKKCYKDVSQCYVIGILFILLILWLVTNHGDSGSVHTQGQCKQNSYSATGNSSADK